MQRKKEKKQEPLGFLANAGIGAGIALGLTLILLFAASFLVTSGRVPERLMGAVTVAALFLGSLLGALIAIRRNRSQRLLVGLSEGAMVYAITFVLGAFAETPNLFGGLSLFLLAAALSGGALAGVLPMRLRRRSA
ncbi:MAG: TIGR04086 family membrane protein [Oscillospiraceae bacterium]|nr:TIGR04086 family membrane protein [Oscillospiraceae bacterium]